MQSYRAYQAQLEALATRPDSYASYEAHFSIRKKMKSMLLEMGSDRFEHLATRTSAAPWDEGPDYWGKATATPTPVGKAVDASMEASGEMAAEIGGSAGLKEFGVDVGIVVFWFLVALVWLRVKNWRRERRRNNQARWQLERERGVEMDEPGWVRRRAAEVEKIAAMLQRLYYHDARVAVRFCGKVAVGAVLLWGWYRFLSFFGKEEWEREDGVDFVLSLGLHVLCAFFCAVLFLGVGFTFIRAWSVGHHNTVEIGNLVDKGASDQYVFDMHGRKIFYAPGALEQKRADDEKQKDLQKASTLTSGLQFSPVPSVPQSRRLTASDRLYNSANGGGGYSDSRRRNPRKAAPRQHQRIFNSFEANLFFMTPIEEDKEMMAVRAKKRNEIWERIPDGMKPEVQRLLWPTLTAANIDTTTPLKRFS
ncbi:MAG: hypothetical protein Q9182_006269 [Xanthomendoza sp. 2 TL-2023]